MLKTFCAGALTGAAITGAALFAVSIETNKGNKVESHILSGDSPIQHSGPPTTLSTTPLTNIPSRDTATDQVAQGAELPSPTGDEQNTVETTDQSTGSGRLDGPDPISVSPLHDRMLGQDRQPDVSSGKPGDLHAALEAESEDYAWSHFTEQALRHFLGAHAEIIYFDVINIECRTSLCEIQAFGVDNSTVPRWAKILHDLRNQPWSEFGQVGTSSSTVDGREVLITYLHRSSKSD